MPTGERGSRSALVFFRSTSLPCCAAIFKINLVTSATAVVVVAVVVVAAVAVVAASAAVYIHIQVHIYIYVYIYICVYIHIYICMTTRRLTEVDPGNTGHPIRHRKLTELGRRPLTATIHPPSRHPSRIYTPCICMYTHM